MSKLIWQSIFAALLFHTLTVSEEESKINFKGISGFWEFGNLVKGVELGLDTLDNMWVQRFGGMFELEASKGDNIDLYVGAGSIFWHAIPEISTATNTQVFFGAAILTRAYIDYKFGDPESPVISTKLGFFPVKYSRSKNLGEYLFRTGSYPSYITTGKGLSTVNTSWEKVLGTQVTHNLSESFSHSLFVTSERQLYPLHDFSITYLANFNAGLFNGGAGLRMNRLIPTKPSQTNPKDKKNTYFEYQGENYTFNSEYYGALSKGALEDADTVASNEWIRIDDMVDSLYDHWDTTAVGKPEYKYFSFQGINPLLYASLDFNEMIGSDLVIYTEAVLMGFQDHPIFYEEKMDRLAVMAGLNIPTFGVLDVLNAEVEYYPSKFVNGYRTQREGHLPLPDYNYNLIEGYDPDDWSGDDLKWSFYLKRSIVSGLSIEAQIASDHLRGRRGSRVVTEQSLLVDSDNWYYFFKINTSF